MGTKVFALMVLFLLIVAQLFDLVSFLAMTSLHGLQAEANPIVVLLAQEIGFSGLTVLKLAVILFAGSVYILLMRHRPRLALGVIGWGIAAGLLGGVTNVATINAW
jgi:hypothetical protein